jgi:hypothetical protein
LAIQAQAKVFSPKRWLKALVESLSMQTFLGVQLTLGAQRLKSKAQKANSLLIDA